MEKLKENMTLLDLTRKERQKNMTEAKQNLFHDLSELFSKPITKEDDILDYIPTQYIAEYVKNLGYDGIAYKSSLDRTISDSLSVPQKTNMVIFHYQKCTPVRSNVYRITDSSIKCEQIDDDKERKAIISPIEEALSQI